MGNWNRYFLRLLIALLIGFAFLYAGDWLVFRVRLAQGSAYSSVEVDQFLATPLKGSKTEYDMVGSFQQSCTRSIFPHQGKAACWWVRRHSSVWE
jgi:hypothetical protein